MSIVEDEGVEQVERFEATHLELFLRRERMRRQWTQLYVASRTGIAVSDLSQVERGLKYPFPSWQRRLAQAFGLPASVLFARTEDERPGAVTGTLEVVTR